MSNTENINIREIIARFQNSAEVIDELRGRLQSLAKTDDLHNASLQATQTAAQALQDLGGQMRNAADLLRDTLTTADTALTTATAFLQATDLSEVGRQLQTVASQQLEFKTEVSAALSELTDAAKAQIAGLRSDLDQAQSEVTVARAERDESEREVERLKAELVSIHGKLEALPDRVRSKHGL